MDVDGAVLLHEREAPIDAELRRRGQAHLDAVRERSPGMFDGPVLALERIEDGVIHAVRASYFDMVATCDALAGDSELRAYAEELAGPDPLLNGYGRAAAIGVTAVVIRNGRFTLGRRADHLALDPGLWHVVPSGTVDARGVRATLLDELAGEHGIESLPPIRHITIGHDLTRLRPEITVITEDLGDIGPPEPSDEFTEFRELRVGEEVSGLELTPAAALALDALRLGSP